MDFTRRSVVAGALASPLALTLSNFANAQPLLSNSWPSGIIKIIVPFPPGGSVDPIARMAQAGMQQKLGASIVIENRPGSSGALGTEIVGNRRRTATPGCSCSIHTQ
jgi:tripartite-type tricarboxylate transporter receptor subunit TctC